MNKYVIFSHCNRWMWSVFQIWCFSAALIHWSCRFLYRHLIKLSTSKPLEYSGFIGFTCCSHSTSATISREKKKKGFHNSSKHFTEQLIPFSCTHSIQMWMRGVLRVGSKSTHRATLVENMCRLRPHCARTYPSPIRGTAATKTFTTLWKNTVQPATTWARSHLCGSISSLVKATINVRFVVIQG